MNWSGRPLRSTRRVENLSTPARLRWYRIENLAGTGPAVISIYDEIGMFGVSAQDFVNELRGVAGRDIELHLNTPGGDVFDGIAIYNTLRQSKGQVSVIIDGLAASAGSFIAMAASPGRLEIAPHAQMMIHNGFAMAIGDASDMRKTADLLDQVTAEIAGIYADRTGKPAAHWLALMAEETWLTDKMCVAQGLADRIHGQDDGLADGWDMSVYSRYSNAAPSHAPITGTHSHEGTGGQPEREHSHDGDADHSGVYDPDGDGDDDSSAEGDTDHDYVLPDGKPGPKARLRNVKKPHGDVPYADPGYLDEDGEQASKSGKEGVARYPVDAEHVEAAWSYINQEKNAGQYTAEQLASIKSKIKGAMKQHGHEVSDDTSNLSHTEILAMFARELASSDAGRE